MITYQDEVAELFHLHTGLERQLQLASLDDDVGEIEQMHFKGVEHALAGYDHLLRLLFDRQRTDQGSDFFSSLPLGELAQTLLAGPNTCVNDLRKI
jgi:hypothetical protein